MEDYKTERDRILDVFKVEFAKLRKEFGSQEAFGKDKEVRLHRNEIGHLERGEYEPGLLTLLILADVFKKDDSFWKLLKSLPVPKQRRPPRVKRDPANP
jgi:DNA-binding XRE family transcriptional regulator